jgi:hypothetical protein
MTLLIIISLSHMKDNSDPKDNSHQTKKWKDLKVASSERGYCGSLLKCLPKTHALGIWWSADGAIGSDGHFRR